VLGHWLALDRELRTLASTGADKLTREQRQEIVGYWSFAFKHWEALCEDESFWSMQAERIHSLDDPRLTTGFLRRFAQSLPIAFDNINADLAIAYCDRKMYASAKDHVKIMKATNAGSDDVDASLRRVTEPLQRRIERAIETAMYQLGHNEAEGKQRAVELFETVQDILNVLQALLGEGSSEYIETCDRVAATIRGCMIDYGNETKNWSQCIAVLKQAASLALDDRLRSRIQEDIGQAEENKKGKDDEEVADLVRRALDVIKAGWSAGGLRMLREALAACHDPSLRQKISTLIYEMDIPVASRRNAERAPRQRSTGDSGGCLNCGEHVSIPYYAEIIASPEILVDQTKSGDGQMIEYECPFCSQTMQSPDDLSGEAEECPNCGEHVSIPYYAEIIASPEILVDQTKSHPTGKPPNEVPPALPNEVPPALPNEVPPALPNEVPPALPAFTEGTDTWQVGLRIEKVECGIGAQKRDDVVRAASLIRQERYEEAESLLDSVLSWFKACMNDRGKTYISVANREELAAIEKEHPDQAFVWIDDVSYGETLHLKTFIAMAHRDLEEALRRSNTVVQFRPYSAAVYIERGGILNQLRQPAKALVAYQKALALAERFSSNANMRAAALRGIGFTHVELKDLSSARRAIEQSLKLDPDNKIARQELNYITDMEKK
jgi:hypothetical protein